MIKKLNPVFQTIFIFIFSAPFLSAKIPQKLEFKPLDYKPPSIEQKTLTCGATLFLLPDHELPLINLTIYVRTGTMYDSPEKVGVASLCGTMIRAGGTKSRKVEAIDEQLEFLGASIETGIDTESGSASLSVLKKDFDQGFELLADILRNPSFDGKKLDIEKAKIIEGIRRRNDDPYQIARREFRKLLYGERHPLSRTQEIPIIKKISKKELVSFYRKYYYPNQMLIAVSGDFDPAEIVSKLEKAFGNWKAADVVFPPVVTVDPKEEKKKMVGYVDKNLNQSSLILGHLGVNVY